MKKSIRRRYVAAVVVAVAAVAAAVAASLASASGSSPGAHAALKPALDGSGENLTNGKRGGTLTVYQAEDFAHLDPGESYYDLDYQVMYATQLPLYEYMPNSASKIEPMLASGPPKISNHGLTVTVHIKPNIHFSPPENRAVTSADVAYAIERAANPNVANAYFQPYFGYIKGAANATGGPIAGIQTPNATTIVFQLVKPEDALLEGALQMPITMPVPKDFAAQYDSQKPTQYGSSYEVFTGPYMIKSDSTGKFAGIGYNVGKNMILVRNPNWHQGSTPQPAYLDEIDINIGGSSQTIGLQVLHGSDSVQNDTPTNTNVQLAYQQFYKQLQAVPGAGDHYVALDNAHGPFKNVWVRRAFYAALDRAAMVKIAGGALVGQVATHFIYPGNGGYSQSGGNAGPKFPWNEHPSGDVALAKTYMKKAGFKSGQYTGSYQPKVVGANEGNSPEQIAIVKQALSSLGFKPQVSEVDQGVMYTKYCGTPKEEIDVCPTVGWIRDFADPQTTLYVPFYGPAITQTNNSNWGQVGGPGTGEGFLNKAMDQAAVAPASKSNEAWAKVDKLLVKYAVAVPWIFDKQPYLESANVRGINDIWNTGSYDYAYTSLDNP
jgi:peptide/nickel transport system substrate-binding protein